MLFAKIRCMRKISILQYFLAHGATSAGHCVLWTFATVIPTHMNRSDLPCLPPNHESTCGRLLWLSRQRLPEQQPVQAARSLVWVLSSPQGILLSVDEMAFQLVVCRRVGLSTNCPVTGMRVYWRRKKIKKKIKSHFLLSPTAEMCAM